MAYEDPAHPAVQFEIVPSVDNADLMWAGASYVFWPILPLPMLFTARGDVPFCRFHFLQSFFFGLGLTSAFVVFSVVLSYVFYSIQPGESMSVGITFVIMFGGWLLVFLLCFVWFMIFAYRAGRGDVFKVLLIGNVIEGWIISRMSAQAAAEYRESEDPLAALGRRPRSGLTDFEQH